MAKLLKYQQFLNEKYFDGSLFEEKYEENPEFRIKSFFTELEKNIRKWFDEGSLKNSELGDIKIAMTHAIEKNLIFEFNDEEYYYQVYIIMSIQDVTEEDLDECFVKVKKYDAADMKLLRTLGEDVSVKDLNEDKILELFAKLDEESSSVEIENDEVTVSDEDTDLEDTSLV